MIFKKNVPVLVVVVTMSLAINCSSSAKRMVETQAPDYKTVKLNEKVVVSYEPEANEEIKSTNVFKEDEFLNLFKSTLKAKGVFSEKAKETIEIKINDVRFRSAIVAILVGIFAGSDSIDLTMTIKDAKGIVIDQHNITISYGLGGFGGGPDSVRSEYFYTKITNLSLQQLGYPID